jgi:hypothetical protein
MTQSNLQALHNYTMTKIQQYASGLIMLSELQEALKAIKLGDVGGLVDPATGLRYP